MSSQLVEMFRSGDLHRWTTERYRLIVARALGFADVRACIGRIIVVAGDPESTSRIFRDYV